MSNARCRIVYVSADAVMTLLGNWRHFESISLPIIKGLPDGYRVEAVHWDFSRQGFAVLVSHESFPEVAAGAEYPVIGYGFGEFESVRLATKGPSFGYTEARRNLVAYGVETTVGTAAPLLPENEIRNDNTVGGFQAVLPEESPELLRWALNHGKDANGKSAPCPNSPTLDAVIQGEQDRVIAGGTRVTPEPAKVEKPKRKGGWEFLGAP